jgi:hypothetical protein
MSVTVQLPNELAEALRVLAGRTGQDLDSTVAGLLEEQLQRQAAAVGPPSPGGPSESTLLHQIQEGLPAETWERYHQLQARREAEQLTPEEHAELIELTDQIEDWNVRRLELAQQLSQRRGVSWQEIVAELGLAAPARG